MGKVKSYTAKLIEVSDEPDCNGRVYDSQMLKKAVEKYWEETENASDTCKKCLMLDVCGGAEMATSVSCELFVE